MLCCTVEGLMWPELGALPVSFVPEPVPQRSWTVPEQEWAPARTAWHRGRWQEDGVCWGLGPVGRP